MNRRNRTLIVIGCGSAARRSRDLHRCIAPCRGCPSGSRSRERLYRGGHRQPAERDPADEGAHQEVPWPTANPVKAASPAQTRSRPRSDSAGPVNEPLTESKLAPIEAGAGLPPSIPPGMRALSVRVNDVIGVAGFTVPGTRVDVMVTLRDAEQKPLRALSSATCRCLTAGTLYDSGKS